jgi:hypothetical protein
MHQCLILQGPCWPGSQLERSQTSDGPVPQPVGRRSPAPGELVAHALEALGRRVQACLQRVPCRLSAAASHVSPSASGLLADLSGFIGHSTSRGLVRRALSNLGDLGRLVPTLSTDVRRDQRAVGIVDLPIFVLADLSPLLGQVSFLNNVGKQPFVRSIGKAKQVVQALG